MSEYDFHQHYMGPLGPHLNCLTHFTRKRKPRDAKLDQSIHRYGRHHVSDTCSLKRKRTLRRAIDGVRLHLERHPNDAASKTRLASFEARLNHAA